MFNGIYLIFHTNLANELLMTNIRLTRVKDCKLSCNIEKNIKKMFEKTSLMNWTLLQI